MPSGQLTAHFFRILYIILFVFSSLLVFFSIDPSMFDFGQFFNIIEYLMLFAQELLRTLAGIAFSVVLGIISIKSLIPIISDLDFGTTGTIEMSSALAQLVNPQNNFFPHSNIDLTNPELNLIEDFSFFIGATAILILLPIALLSGLGFLSEGDTKLAIYSFLGFQLIIIIAIFTKKILISTVIDSSNILAMIFSPIFFLGFLLYLLLEVAFQTSYTLNIIEPMNEREKRIQEHLRRIRTFTFVPQTEEETKREEQSIKSIQSKKFDLLAASYLREMVEQRLFKRGEEVVQDAKSMMRLQSYLASLNQTDPETDLKLAAKTAQADITISNLLKNFSLPMISRIIAVILLSYFIIAPEGILNFFMAVSFPALLDSLELSQPEFRTIAILNVALILILIGVILHWRYEAKKVITKVVQQIDTLVEFDRAATPTATSSSEEIVEDEKTEEDTPEDETE